MSVEIRQTIPFPEAENTIKRILGENGTWVISSGGRQIRIGTGPEVFSGIRAPSFCSRHGRVKRDAFHVKQEGHLPGDWCLTPEHNIPGEDALAIRREDGNVLFTSPSGAIEGFLEEKL